MFAYGCDASLKWPSKIMEEQIFIKMLELNGPGHFSLADSRFHVKAVKESTGRVNTWQEIKCMNTFTIEATFCGSRRGALTDCQFNTHNFEQVGPIICDTILDYFDPDGSKKALVLYQLRREVKHAVGSSLDQVVYRPVSSLKTTFLAASIRLLRLLPFPSVLGAALLWVACPERHAAFRRDSQLYNGICLTDFSVFPAFFLGCFFIPVCCQGWLRGWRRTRRLRR